MKYFAVILMGYLLGCSNMALYLSKWKKVDLRAGGSGNLGASNAVILMGWKAGVLTALHDIGKAVDQTQEGTHIELGVELARRYGEKDEIVHAIEAHHDDVTANTIEAVLVKAEKIKRGDMQAELLPAEEKKMLKNLSIPMVSRNPDVNVPIQKLFRYQYRSF